MEVVKEPFKDYLNYLKSFDDVYLAVRALDF